MATQEVFVCDGKRFLGFDSAWFSAHGFIDDSKRKVQKKHTHTSHTFYIEKLGNQPKYFEKPTNKILKTNDGWKKMNYEKFHSFFGCILSSISFLPSLAVPYSVHIHLILERFHTISNCLLPWDIYCALSKYFSVVSMYATEWQIAKALLYDFITFVSLLFGFIVVFAQLGLLFEFDGLVVDLWIVLGAQSTIFIKTNVRNRERIKKTIE